MTENFWKDKYPAGISADIDPDAYPNVLAVLKQSCQRFADKPAFTNMGKTLTYGEMYELSGAFAAYLQEHTDLQPGDRIAVQMPNVLQYPIVVFGAIRAGLVVVNTNPLYTVREMEHQFNDSGAKALVSLANMAHLAEQVLPKTGIKTVIITEVGDMLSPLKRLLQICDGISLWLCSALVPAVSGASRGIGEDAIELHDVPRRAWTDRCTITVTPLGGRRVKFDPYPCDIDPLPVLLPARVVELPGDPPARVQTAHFHAAHFQTWWHARQPRSVEFTVVSEK